MFRHYISIIGLTLIATSAIAAPEDDYVIYQTATEINKACGGLKYLEHQRTLGAAREALENTAQYRMSNDGRLPEADYDAWLAGLDAKVTAQVQSVGCTEQAMQFIIRGKGIASEEIYRGLVLAVHFGSAPATDIINYVEIEPDRFAALQRYDGYLQALYRDNFQQFAARQKEIAAQELPALNPFGSSTGFGFGLESSLMSPEDMSKTSNAQSIAAFALDAVFFEVTAESAGFIVRPRPIQENWTIPELRPAAAAQEPGLMIVNGPGYDLVDLRPGDGDSSSSKLYSVLALTPENRLRVMYYGDAAGQVVNGTVRLYVRSQPPPAGASPYAFFTTPGFREGALAYDGLRVATGCLSAACFDFPPEATDAFVADKTNEYAEIFVSPLPGAQPAAQEDIASYKAGRVSNFYAYKLLRE